MVKQKIHQTSDGGGTAATAPARSASGREHGSGQDPRLERVLAATAWCYLISWSGTILPPVTL